MANNGARYHVLTAARLSQGGGANSDTVGTYVSHLRLPRAKFGTATFNSMHTVSEPKCYVRKHTCKQADYDFNIYSRITSKYNQGMYDRRQSRTTTRSGRRADKTARWRTKYISSLVRF